MSIFVLNQTHTVSCVGQEMNKNMWLKHEVMPPATCIFNFQLLNLALRISFQCVIQPILFIL